MSNLYLAWTIATPGKKLWARWDYEAHPVNWLVSFHYLDDYQKFMATSPHVKPQYRMLDSGAYSAWNSGKEIDINLLTQETKNPEWNESVSLDVISTPELPREKAARLSLENARKQRKLGSPSYPVFHFGEPWDVLDAYVKEFPKVGLSCRFGEPDRQSYWWLGECFRRHWPHPFHSFGWIGRKVLTTFPFHSADAATWAIMSMKYGRWASMNGAALRVRKFTQNGLNLDSEVLFYLEFERELKGRWKKELQRWPDVISPRLKPATSVKRLTRR